MSSQASLLLDIVRSLAALAVMAGHWRNIFFVDYRELPAHASLFAVPYVLTSGGRQAVLIFFVLSGYLISGSVFRMFARGTWSWRSYLLHRLVRLWIVLIPGLLIVALCDFAGLHLHRPAAIALYHGTIGNAVIGDVSYSFNVSTWLGNLFFLQGTRVVVFGSDTALWSLANEFWYYMLFPLGLIALRRQTRLWMRAVCIAAFAAVAWSLNPQIVVLFPIWLMGTALAAMPILRISKAWRIAAACVYVPCVFIMPKLNIRPPVLLDLAFGLLTTGFLYVLLSAPGPVREDRRMTHVWRTTARFSYTLYVIHLPLLALLAGLTLSSRGRWVPSAPHLAVAVAYLVAVVAFCWGIASLTEFRTDSVRRAIERRLPRHVFARD